MCVVKYVSVSALPHAITLHLLSFGFLSISERCTLTPFCLPVLGVRWKLLFKVVVTFYHPSLVTKY